MLDKTSITQNPFWLIIGKSVCCGLEKRFNIFVCRRFIVVNFELYLKEKDTLSGHQLII